MTTAIGVAGWLARRRQPGERGEQLRQQLRPADGFGEHLVHLAQLPDLSEVKRSNARVLSPGSYCAIVPAAAINQALYATISSRLAQPKSRGTSGSGP